MTKKPWRVIMRRELAAYFASPVAYIVGCLFLVFAGWMLFSTFFIAGRAELRQFFQSLPVIYSIFIPILTMRVFSEEKRSGTIETLLTLPVTVRDVVLGKYLAALLFSLSLLVPTLFYVLACYIFGTPDAGPIIGGYLGAIFLAAAYTAIGVFASALTKNQIVAVFISFAICLVLSLMGSFMVLLPAALVRLLTFISAASHFDSIARGIVDSRDVLYFASVTAAFIVLTVQVVQNGRRGLSL